MYNPATLFCYLLISTGSYLISLGSEPGSDDVSPYMKVENTVASHCFSDVSLVHNAKYYATIIAFNGASVPKNTSGSSEGGKNMHTQVC